MAAEPINWRKSDKFPTLSAFQKAVYVLTEGIPAGRVTTYGVMGSVLLPDRPCAQAVGTALHHNPFPPHVPCHRIVKGSVKAANPRPVIGGFEGNAPGSHCASIDKKRDLLAKEGVLFDSQQRLADLKCLLTREEDWSPAAVLEARAYLNNQPVAQPKSKLSKTPAPTTGAAAQPQEADESSVRALLSKEGTTGAAVRLACRDGRLTGHTSGLAPGLAQANLVLLPKEHAYDFLLYCTRNPKPCPLLEVTQPGQAVLSHKAGSSGAGAGASSSSKGQPTAPGARSMAPGCDLRTDLPRYCVWKNGVCVDRPTDIKHLWPDAQSAGASSSSSSAPSHPDARPDWVAFLLGCSFSFEEALLKGGIPVRHLQEEKEGQEQGEEGAGRPAKRAKTATAGASSSSSAGREPLVANPRNVPMYRTNIPTAPAGPFSGPLVVSMRPMTPGEAQQAADITARFPRVHGRCVHIGDAASIGIADIGKPHYGDAVTIRPGEVPVFWACGVTPQAALTGAKLPIAITHAPGHMLVLDVPNADLAGEAGVR